ncbi:MAG TPA: acyl-CoA reductase [Bacteroidia bacterium]|jgi:hypothetical protein|nr:acyl-CoA reductase [Bacteroidia bacterium]
MRKTIFSHTTGSHQSCDDVFHTPRVQLRPFDPLTLQFLNQLSVCLLADKRHNRNPEIVSLGFWLRKSNVDQFHKENMHWLDHKGYTVTALGPVFHVAPSNVDTIFLYSATVSLLMGNTNVVRLSSDLSPSVQFIISCINHILALPENEILRPYLSFISYGHEDEISTYFSSEAQGRVIWGGDQTVLHFKSLKSGPALRDIIFPNRVSHSLIKAKSFLDADDEAKALAAKNFFNDAYVFDQLGCSSPRVIFVYGTIAEKESFIPAFYKELDKITKTRYTSEASALSIVKFNHLVDDLMDIPVRNITKDDNTIYLIETDTMPVSVDNCVGGYFYLRHISSLEELSAELPLSTQTLSYFGLQETDLKSLQEATSRKRIDRIVPMGQSLSFHYLWDGMNLFEQLSRKRAII